ncbi:MULTISPECIES: DUF4082 domain-containing protein [unclassified Nocardioides]|uniref:DUF4082 domain-containing protein n=1 Tax=unclassified Nocardioides TaxID=2615069 RepID=UPI003614431C
MSKFTRVHRAALAAVVAASLWAAGGSTGAAGRTTSDSEPDQSGGRAAYGLWSGSARPADPVASDRRRVRVGVEFSSRRAGKIRAVRFYRGTSDRHAYGVQLSTARGKVLARGTARARSGPGWRVARLSHPVRVKPGRHYVASYLAPRGRYATTRDVLSPSDPVRHRALTAWRGTLGGQAGARMRHTSTHYWVDVRFLPRRHRGGNKPAPTPAPAPTPVAPGVCVQPTAANTGASGNLATYTGPTTLTTPGQIIENVRVNGSLQVLADNVTIRNVAATGGVFVDRAWNTTISHFTGTAIASSSGPGMTVEYSNLGGATGGDSLTVTSDNGTYITGATIRGNWIHDPKPTGDQHYDGIQVRGASNVVIDCNNFDLGAYQTQYNAAVYFEQANGGYSAARVTNNWLTGGAFSVMFGAANDGSTVLSGNKFGGDIHWDTCYAQQSNSTPPTQLDNTRDGRLFTPC